MFRTSLLIVVLLYPCSLFAGEPEPANLSPVDHATGLVARIEELERRVRELERHVTESPFGSPYESTVPLQAYPAPQPQTSPHQPTQPKQDPRTHYPPTQTIPNTPFQPPQPTVPESWKPFEFNGMRFYIIPVAEAERIFSNGSNRLSHPEEPAEQKGEPECSFTPSANGQSSVRTRLP